MGLKAKILVIDDNEIIRTLLQELLTRNGYSTVVASDGLTALKILEDVKPHLALVDLMLPDISGIEVIKQIRKISPITESIIITGYSSYESAKEILSSQVSCGLLEKPVDVNKLLATVREIFERQKNKIKIEEDFDAITNLNYQLEFFNTLLFRDFRILTNALAESIELLKDDSLSEKQKRCLAIINSIYYNNTRLMHSYKKMKKIHSLNEEEFICLDIIEILKQVTIELEKVDVSCSIEQLSNYSTNEFLVMGTKNEMEELFYELFFSMIMPGILNQKVINLKLTNSEALINENEEYIPTVELKLTVKSDNTPKTGNATLTEFESQKYGLGFFIVKNIVDIFKGKIFLEDKRENDNLITTVVIYIPAFVKG